MQEVLERLEFWKDRLAEFFEDLTFSISEKVQDVVWALEDRLERLGESWEEMSLLIQHANAELARIAEHRGALAVAWG